MALEPINTRYTGQWFDYIPELLKTRMKVLGKEYEIETVSGPELDADTTPGAFLNFSNTNIWKNEQMNKIASKFYRNEIKAGDKFLYTDAWNPTIMQLKYMSSLLGIPIEIYSIWHAGSYDPWDFLGDKLDKTWSLPLESALFHASDCNFFATKYHWEMFYNRVIHRTIYNPLQRKIAGLPFNYLEQIFSDSHMVEKENIILFPHRISKEKQPDIFRDLKSALPEYTFIMCQEENMSKQEYHDLLKKSKMVFSANLQETLGISCWEGMLSGAYPFMPDRLSYSEMYTDYFLYPSEWTITYDNYKEYKPALINAIRERMDNYDNVRDLSDYCKIKTKEFFNGTAIADCIINSNYIVQGKYI